MDLATGIANARLQAIADGLDADDDPGEIRFYAGTVPSPPGSALTNQTLLATAEFGQPAGSVANRELTFDLPASVQAVEAGTVSFARCYDGAGFWVADLSVGEGDPQAAWQPADPDIVIDSADVLAGALIVILSAAVVE